MSFSCFRKGFGWLNGFRESGYLYYERLQCYKENSFLVLFGVPCCNYTGLRLKIYYLSHLWHRGWVLYSFLLASTYEQFHMLPRCCPARIALRFCTYPHYKHLLRSINSIFFVQITQKTSIHEPICIGIGMYRLVNKVSLI